MSDITTTEKEFLIGLALLQFNIQFNRKFLVSECDIVSIVPNSYSDRGYEIVTNRLDDLVRMRIYITFDTEFHASPYRLDNNGAVVSGGLGDEVYVSDMKIPKYYLDEGIYKFRWLEADLSRLPVFLTEDGVPFLTELGMYFIPEKDPIYQSV